eukprot:753680-Hanusia_phi.AAC.7
MSAGTSVWNPSMLSTNYAQEFSIWKANCSAENCHVEGQCTDTITQGFLLRDCLATDGMNSIGVACSTTTINNAKCTSGLGEYTNASAATPVILQGIYEVIPSGIPDKYPLPFLVTLLVNPTICERMDSGAAGTGGAVLINNFESRMLARRTSKDSCKIVLQVQTNGELKPGPAVLSLVASNAQGTYDEILVNGNQACPYFHNLGVSLGRLYIYRNPSSNATIVASHALNANCDLYVFVKMPFFTQTMRYGQYFCFWKDQGERSWNQAGPTAAIFDAAIAARGVQCHISGSRSSQVLLKVSINGLQGTYHQLTAFITRLGDPSARIPGEGIDPCSSVSCVPCSCLHPNTSRQGPFAYSQYLPTVALAQEALCLQFAGSIFQNFAIKTSAAISSANLSCRLVLEHKGSG